MGRCLEKVGLWKLDGEFVAGLLSPFRYVFVVDMDPDKEFTKCLPVGPKFGDRDEWRLLLRNWNWGFVEFVEDEDSDGFGAIFGAGCFAESKDKFVGDFKAGANGAKLFAL